MAIPVKRVPIILSPRRFIENALKPSSDTTKSPKFPRIFFVFWLLSRVPLYQPKRTRRSELRSFQGWRGQQTQHTIAAGREPNQRRKTIKSPAENLRSPPKTLESCCLFSIVQLSRVPLHRPIQWRGVGNRKPSKGGEGQQQKSHYICWSRTTTTTHNKNSRPRRPTNKYQIRKINLLLH